MNDTISQNTPANTQVPSILNSKDTLRNKYQIADLEINKIYSRKIDCRVANEQCGQNFLPKSLNVDEIVISRPDIMKGNSPDTTKGISPIYGQQEGKPRVCKPGEVGQTGGYQSDPGAKCSRCEQTTDTEFSEGSCYCDRNICSSKQTNKRPKGILINRISGGSNFGGSGGGGRGGGGGGGGGVGRGVIGGLDLDDSTELTAETSQEWDPYSPTSPTKDFTNCSHSNTNNNKHSNNSNTNNGNKHGNNSTINNNKHSNSSTNKRSSGSSSSSSSISSSSISSKDTCISVGSKSHKCSDTVATRRSPHKKHQQSGSSEDSDNKSCKSTGSRKSSRGNNNNNNKCNDKSNNSNTKKVCDIMFLSS